VPPPTHEVPQRRTGSNSGLERVRPEVLDREENSEREQNRAERHVTQLVVPNMRVGGLDHYQRKTDRSNWRKHREKLHAAGRRTPTAPRASTVAIPLISRSVKSSTQAILALRGARLSSSDPALSNTTARSPCATPGGCVHGIAFCCSAYCQPQLLNSGQGWLAAFRASGSSDPRQWALCGCS